MEAKEKDIVFPELSRRIMAAAFNVLNTLGCGFLEKVYENAMVVEMRDQDLSSVVQVPFDVKYRDETVGTYVADIVVEDSVLLELKVAQKIDSVHRAQVMNYLKASGLKLGIILNFAKPKLEFERIVL